MAVDHKRMILRFSMLGVLVLGVAGWRLTAELEKRRGPEVVTVVPESPATRPLAVLGQVPDFELTERSGRTVSARSLRGQVWLVDFIFTNCAGPCPLMTARMARLQKALAADEGVKLVSVTVDPARDTPAVLTAYAQKHGADPEKWLFLTGSGAEIEDLVLHGFKLGSVDNPVYHSTRFVLVDGNGAIRGYYDSESAGVIERLVRDMRTLRDSKGGDWRGGPAEGGAS